jgi:hypothetical protein
MSRIYVDLKDEEGAILAILCLARAVSVSEFVRRLILVELARMRLIPDCDLENLGIDARDL